MFAQKKRNGKGLIDISKAATDVNAEFITPQFEHSLFS